MKRIFLIGILPFFLLTACDKWLDIVPEEDMTTIDTDFETRDEAENWLLSCHMFLQKTIPGFEYNEAFVGSDELVAGDFLLNRPLGFEGLKIAAGLQNSLNPYCDIWSQKDAYKDGRTDYYTAINMCNIFISKIDQVNNLDDSYKREWKAEIQALKAYYYFELVRHYGPIILVPENIDPNVPVEEMKVPRSPVDACFKAIVDLCDEAAKNLTPFNSKETDHRTFFNKEAALALKARALLYQASDLFNGNSDYANFTNKNGEPLFSTTRDEKKWRLAAEAAEEAIRVCLENGKHLVNDRTGNTPLQTTMANIEASVQTFNYTSDEALLMFKGAGNSVLYNYILPKIKSDKTNYLSGTSLAPSMKAVKMFYTEHGVPIDQDSKYHPNPYILIKETDPKYTDVVGLDMDILALHCNREPRFYANIAADRCYWRQGRTLSDLRLVEAYKGEEFGLKEKVIDPRSPQNLSGYWVKKWLSSKAALTNYASDVKAMGMDPYPVIRMAELYLIAAEAWTECGELEKAYENLNVVRERAGIPSVQEAWTNYAKSPKHLTKEGMREIVRQEWNIEFIFENMRFWNLRRWKTASIELNEKQYGWNVLGTTAAAFYNDNNGEIIVNSGKKFVAPRDYFWPIRSEETQISGCVQNPGW